MTDGRVRRRRTLGLSVAVCAFLSACDVASGGNGGEETLLKPTANASSASNAKGLGGTALESSAVEGFTVSRLADPHDVQVARDDCAPLAQAFSGAVIGRPVSTEVREATGEGAKAAIVLAEYSGNLAQSVMDTLAVSAAECADGFTATVDGVERKFEKAAPEIAPEGADQVMGLGAVVRGDGAETPVKAVVLRKGNIVAYLSAVPDGGAAEGFSVPAVVINAQLAKLG